MSGGHVSGLLPRESEVMDRWEAGEPVETIAEAVGLHRHRVAKIVSFFAIGADGSDAWDRMVRAGDRRYQAALAAAGGSYR